MDVNATSPFQAIGPNNALRPWKIIGWRILAAWIMSAVIVGNRQPLVGGPGGS